MFVYRVVRWLLLLAAAILGYQGGLALNGPAERTATLSHVHHGYVT